MTPENGHQPEASDTPDTAVYIASMADELARLAKSQRADDRHHRKRQRARIAADGDQRRRIVDHLQARRIVGFAQRHQGDTELLCGGKLALGVGARANLHGTTGAAPARQ